MKSPSYFPIRLFRWFLTRQVILAGLLILLFYVPIAVWLEGLESDRLELGRTILLAAFGLAFVAMVLASIFMARRLLIPLGRLIQKTRRMREAPLGDEDAESLSFDEPGEWYELERALNKLGTDLHQKTVSLSREKTELRAIMSAVSEAVLAINHNKKVLFFNPQFAFLFDVSPGHSEARISEILRDPEVLETYSSALKSGSPARQEFQITVSQERLPRHFQLSVAPLIKKHNGEVYGAVGIFHDITELKQAERIRIEFVGNVSHELRTPLTTINGYLQTLTSDFEKGRTEDAKDFLKIVSQNVSRLKNLVEDLLDLSALESGKELHMEVVNVRDLTEAVLKQIQVKSHKIHLNYDFATMVADGKRLEQVLRNLLENAVRYVPEGRSIEVRWTQGASGKLELHVKDDGPGIAVEHQSRLFERFYRVDEGRARAAGGTGIGLSLVKHIVQRHGGQVFVRSQLGLGSEFICEFPPQKVPK